MKKFFKFIVCLTLSLFIMGTTVASASAASVGKVKSVSAKNVTDSSVTLSWKKVTGATGYKVYQYNSSSKKWNNVKITSSLSCTLSSLSSAKTYKYKVKAYYKENGKTTHGTASSALTVTTLPKTPSDVSVSEVASTKVVLSWKKVSGSTGYKIYRYDENAQTWKAVKKTKKLTYTVSSLTEATTYKFRVRAYKTVNDKNIYSKPTTALKVTTLPQTPKNVKVSSLTATTATLSWSQAKGATGYRIFRYNASTGKYQQVTTTKKTTYSLKNLSACTAYKYKIRAYYSVGTTVVWSKYSSACSFTTKPDSVKSLKVSSSTTSTYTLSWGKVSGATGYQIARYDTSSKSWKTAETVTGTSHTFTNLTSSTSAQYKVRAFVKSGSDIVYGAYSSSVTASTCPETPLDLKATASDTYISLSWAKAENASGYEISRYDAANGSWKVIGTAITTAYNDTSVSQTSIYTYRIRAYYTVGDASFYSAYSSSASAAFEASEEVSNEYIEQMEKNGILGYLYDAKGKYFYTAADPWQRIAGYNSVYDVIAPFTLIDYDTDRVYFTWGDKDWLVQFWKGQYGLIFYGAEIGVYTKPTSRNIAHYDCATEEDFLKMSMTFYERKYILFSSSEWDKVFTRPYGEYWWCTGFVPGNVFGQFGNLRIDARITMKDYAMLMAFKKGLEDTSFTYTVSGLDVYISYI